MKRDTVIGIDKRPVLRINKVLDRELCALSETQLKDLKKSIERDGILSPILYWVNPENGRPEIVDGHHRYRIAQELEIDYEIRELKFASIAKAQYWMHRTNAGRRGGQRDAKRMAELLAIVKAENDEAVTKTQIVEEVAKDAGISESTVWRETKPVAELTPEQQEAATIKVILRYLNKLSDAGRERLKSMM